MRQYKIYALAILMIGCMGQDDKETKEIIATNSFLLGTWSGMGNFLDVSFAKDMGEVFIEVEIKEDNSINGHIGDSELLNLRMKKAEYGFAIYGELESKLNRKKDFEKDCLVILLVLAQEGRDSANSSDANFHLKSNFFFDFAMRVGGVTLTKSKDI
ncbi:MAG: hypothetical protein JXQ96_13555 [Cyclobacteriaceae bacterium]